jgi:diguanylate cyclase (GGDEF)-like protein
MPDRDTSAQPPLVLVANDQEWSARSLESILAPNGYSVIRAYTGRQALERMRQAQPDLVILDAQLPDMHGFDICRALRSDPRVGPTTPIIITTSGPSGRAQRLEAYRAGAWEFLGQPLDGESLLLRMRTFIQSKVEVDRLREECLVDEVSGFYNMRGLARRARELGSEAQRRHQPLACVVFAPDAADDLDAESLDRVAERVGMVFRESGRVSDAVGRLGAAEFAVIAPSTDSMGAMQLVERMGGSLAAASVPVAGEDRRLETRAGICAVGDFAESDADTVELLLRATTALRELRRDKGTERVREFATTN